MRQLPRLQSDSHEIAADNGMAVNMNAAAQDSQAGLSLTQMLAILRSNWKTSLIVWLALSAIAAIAIKFLPKTYTAMSSMIVNIDNKDTLANTAFPVEIMNSYVATQAEMMTTPAVLLTVVDRLNLTADKDLTAGFRGDPAALRDYVERNVGYGVSVDQGRGGQLIYISASARDPQKAAAIANMIATVYLEQESRRMNDPAGERAKRYGEQLQQLQAKVNAAQEKLDNFRKQKGVTDLSKTDAEDNNVDPDTQALTSLQDRLLDAENQVRALEAKLAGGSGSASSEALSSQAVQQLQSQLHTQQANLASISAIYGPQHPQVLALKSQIASTQHALNSELGNLGENTQSQLQQARALVNKYERAVEDQRAKVLKMRDVQGEGAQLELELDSASSVYKKALDGYDQIMFQSAGSFTNVSMVDRAVPPTKPTKPNKFNLLMLGTIVSLGLATGVPFLYELLFNRRIRCKDDIERSFGIPVLAQFDAFAAAGEHA